MLIQLREARLEAHLLFALRRQLRREFVGKLFALAQHGIENLAAPFGMLQRLLLAGDTPAQLRHIALAAGERQCLRIDRFVRHRRRGTLPLAQRGEFRQFALRALQSRAQFSAGRFSQAQLLVPGVQSTFELAQFVEIFPVRTEDNFK